MDKMLFVAKSPSAHKNVHGISYMLVYTSNMNRALDLFARKLSSIYSYFPKNVEIDPIRRCIIETFDLDDEAIRYVWTVERVNLDDENVFTL